MNIKNRERELNVLLVCIPTIGLSMFIGSARGGDLSVIPGRGRLFPLVPGGRRGLLSRVPRIYRVLPLIPMTRGVFSIFARAGGFFPIVPRAGGGFFDPLIPAT